MSFPNLFFIPEGNLRFARTTKTPSGEEPLKKLRHLDRSGSQPHREQRSGETPFSTQLPPATEPGAPYLDSEMWAFARRREPFYFPDSKSPPSRTHSQNGNPPKINPESVACFQPRNTTINSPRNHHNPTTNSPSKNHVQHNVFSKPPSKNTKNRARTHSG